VGLVGHDVLQHYTVEIDYGQRRVRLFDPARYRYKGTGATVRFTPDADLPLLRAHVKVRAAAPSRPGCCSIGRVGPVPDCHHSLHEQHGLNQVTPAIEAPIGTGLVGELHGTIVRLQELRLGGIKVPSLPPDWGRVQGFSSANRHRWRRRQLGVRGIASDRRLCRPPRHRGAPTRRNSPCDFDMSGLRLAARGPGLRQIVVDYVIPQSPSAEAGIAVGDELLLIDGRGVAEGD